MVAAADPITSCVGTLGTARAKIRTRVVPTAAGRAVSAGRLRGGIVKKPAGLPVTAGAARRRELGAQIRRPTRVFIGPKAALLSRKVPRTLGVDGPRVVVGAGSGRARILALAARRAAGTPRPRRRVYTPVDVVDGPPRLPAPLAARSGALTPLFTPRVPTCARAAFGLIRASVASRSGAKTRQLRLWTGPLPGPILVKSRETTF